MNLTVKIPKKYRKDLSYGFNPNNAEIRIAEEISFKTSKAKLKPICNKHYMFFIRRKCPLCSVHFLCIDCPFVEFATYLEVGCKVWLTILLGNLKFDQSKDGIWWWKKNDIEARKQLKDLRKKAKELIIWI